MPYVAEAMPPCLADRIVEEHRADNGGGGGCDDSRGGERDEGSSPRHAGTKCMSLAGGFLFIRGVFYVTRPAAGEASGT